MENSARWHNLLRGATALVVLAIPVVSQARQLHERLSVRRSGCPCAAEYASFFDTHPQLLACTNNVPFNNFVRLVAANIDLVVLFEFPPQLHCGWQPAGSFTSWKAVTARQFDSCKRLIVKAAAAHGMPCLREIETLP
jgi:hypothetical protein